MKRKIFKFIAYLLAVSILLSNIMITPITAYAFAEVLPSDSEETIEAKKDAQLPNSAGDWYTAINVDKLPWNFFHNQVQKHIRDKYDSIGKRELQINSKNHLKIIYCWIFNSLHGRHCPFMIEAFGIY